MPRDRESKLSRASWRAAACRSYSPVAIAPGATLLPMIDAAAEIAPILLVQAAYRMIASLAVQRGLDPDHPPHLCKITETL